MALNRIKERKEKRQKRIMSVVLTLIMVASGFGIYLSGRGAATDTLQDAGLTFTIDYDNNVYQTKIDGQKMSFFYLPSSLASLPVDKEAFNVVNQASALVVSFNPVTSAANLQVMDLIRYDVSTTLSTPLINAVSEESSYYNLPVVTCANATAQMPVLFIKEAEAEGISVDNNCVILQGNASGLLQVRDAFIYGFYGVE